ncbi:amino acid ABC transporter permease [Arthrobacter mobilis]|uniref:Amino acid ABC transporter permease n=1 Tax=Arthrobacter mobilis TaxID=2724944 RepID=A0A7X6QMD8_9MICC|nr:amino acid ABC transporter permease [Arthrobacter mobilis]NKX56671.1 amino acid ABC transporter permease [Arthrobacter mobilis]
MTGILASFSAIIAGLGTTLLLAVGGFVLGAVIALPLAWARVSSFPALRFLAGGYIEIVRGIPPIVWLFVLYFGLTQFNLQLTSLGAAVLGLGVISSGYIAEIYRAGLSSVPGGQREAAQALSLPLTSSFVHVTAPQALVAVIPLAVAYFIGLLKDSAVASVIGAQDITAMALALSKRSLDGLTVFAIAGAVYLIISFPVAMFGRWLGQKAASRWAVRV